jgi:serine phosphatase RsbU (regulator of sigma subunit)
MYFCAKHFNTKSRKMPKILQIIFLILCTASSIRAQNVIIKGTAADKNGTSFQGVQITVNDNATATSKQDGSFNISLPASNLVINKLTAVKKGYKLRSYDFSAEEKRLEVVLEAAVKIYTGKVLNDNGSGVASADVLVDGVGMNQPVFTDEKGNFKVEIPEDESITNRTRIAVNGKYLDKSFFTVQGNQITIRFGKRAEEITYAPVEEPVKNEVTTTKNEDDTEKNETSSSLKLVIAKIYLKDKKGKLLSDVVATHKQQNYKSNSKGELPIKDFDQAENLTINGFEIVDFDTLSERGILFITLDKLDPRLTAYNTDINKVINDLELEKQTLLEKSLTLRTQIENIFDKLQKDENLTPEQKSKLERQIELLQNQLVKNDMALEEAQSKTRMTLEHLKRMLVQKDSLHNLATEKLEEIEAEKIMQEKRIRQNFIIFSIIVAVLSVFALISYRVATRIRRQKEEISRQAEDLILLNKEVTQKNQNITDSIRYARTIQDALLPSKNSPKRFFSDSFVLSVPKDIVSGDFYWFSELEPYFFVVAADCTGHGVSGAFMSLVGNTLLNEIINEKEFTVPAKILEMLDERIRVSLKQDEQLNQDGMDLAICRFEKKDADTTEMYFSGAKRPCYLIKANQSTCEVIKGTTRSLGGGSKNEKVFAGNVLELKKGDKIYLCSDGAADQCNTERQKLGTKKLLELFENSAYLDAESQKAHIAKYLENFASGAEQRDDILIINVRI